MGTSDDIAWHCVNQYKIIVGHVYMDKISWEINSVLLPIIFSNKLTDNQNYTWESLCYTVVSKMWFDVVQQHPVDTSISWEHLEGIGKGLLAVACVFWTSKGLWHFPFCLIVKAIAAFQQAGPLVYGLPTAVYWSARIYCL